MNQSSSTQNRELFDYNDVNSSIINSNSNSSISGSGSSIRSKYNDNKNYKASTTATNISSIS